MAIDIGRELTVRCIAHNVALRHAPLSDVNEATRYAVRVAEVIDPEHAVPLATAAIALWSAGAAPRALDVTLAGLQPEEAPAHDY